MAPPATVSDKHSSTQIRTCAVTIKAQRYHQKNSCDVVARGFWGRGATTIFDVRIADTDAPTYRNWDPVKALVAHGKEKKDKYLKDCLARHFTTLAFSIDCLRGVVNKYIVPPIKKRLTGEAIS